MSARIRFAELVMAIDARRRFRFRRPVGLRPVMLRAGLAIALLAMALVAMKAKAAACDDHGRAAEIGRVD